ncbi:MULTISPECIES: SIMPL domain-containing protein [unclassified Streptomyces]|uniref:SIMPL domain-containing protein n=1 Tax=unclassified Streptomyces TaxID=2593676 RepID=UPI000F5B9123|nr:MULTISPECIES: SIMPL domain-containing protein [unclassified Streptomyces]WSG50201.1 SIMPL domain-containing protein [Streptomyces sp. NBC_01732]WSX00855.1 SIMPL domain-containing protein [Streptomyces sp. NBC_00987]MCX4397316.1 SIMPL domain-containing protein [Streptomyces sp. NBC_01767]MCX5099981.1 SIMPL domain-containing protein [Streptomyces sp. NBC_00439]MCX5159527.1 SIMPL domain-containing protein [Streptomyces sp. NBC_00305]
MTDTPPSYGTPEHPRVAVRGEARLEVDPETARIGITVTARGKNRRNALEDLTRRNDHVLELARSYGQAVEKLETGAFSITPELTQKGRNEQIHAYHGRVHITAVLNDFTALGEFTTRIADLEMTRVNGPWWGLRPDSPAHATARRQAVHEAVQRAREYADALGAQLTALVELADLGAENAAPPVPAAPGAMRGRAAFAGAAPEAAPTLDLEPQRQTVYAQVNARFIMSPPKL